MMPPRHPDSAPPAMSPLAFRHRGGPDRSGHQLEAGFRLCQLQHRRVRRNLSLILSPIRAVPTAFQRRRGSEIPMRVQPPA